MHADAPTHQRRVACPRSRGHVLAMQGGVRRPMATQVWPCHPRPGWQPLSVAKWVGLCKSAGQRHPLHPSGSVAATRRFFGPPPNVMPTGGPKARSGGIRSSSPSARPGGMPTLAWACPGDAGGRSSSHGHAKRGHATQRMHRPPLECHPDRRAEGPQWRDPFKQHFHKAPDAMPQHTFQRGVNVDLRPLNAMTQPTRRSTP